MLKCAGSYEYVHQFSSVQSLSRVQLFATPWTAARQVSLSITKSQSLLKLMSIELVMPFNHLILCFSPSPPAFNFSQYQDLFKLELSQLCPPLRALHPPDMAFALEPRRMGSSAGRRRKMNTGASGWSAGTQLQAGKQIYSQFTSVVQSCPTLCSGMDCNTPGLPVHHQIPELAQTHVH